MSEEKKEEWAIRDEASGEWSGPLFEWGPIAYRHSYETAIMAYRNLMGEPQYRHTARIVPAPPREMSDAECWEWLHERGDQTNWIVRASYGDAGVWYCGGNTRDLAAWAEYHGYGATPCDAIRAARRKLEVGK